MLRKSKIKILRRYAVCSILLALALTAVLAGCSAPSDTPAGAGGSEAGQTPQPTEAQPATQEASAGDAAQGADLVIPISDISEKATFYPVEIDGTKLEVLAVKAPDGSVRTAFNTCQVCYDSGRGYYKQEGDELVCQNCGNRFSMDQVEVTKGGCNPVPITAEYKTVTDEAVTIPYDFLNEAKVIFANWKAE